MRGGEDVAFLSPYPRQIGIVGGVDINAKTHQLVPTKFEPPTLFAMATTSPHLPFEDNYFDLVLLRVRLYSHQRLGRHVGFWSYAVYYVAADMHTLRFMTS